MGIKTLIERLNQYSQSLIAYKLGADFADACMDAAVALSTLQSEKEKLRVELEQVKMECDAAQSLLAERIGVRGAEPITTAFGLPLARIRKLAAADQEGRCVVLLRKIGDPVWRLYDDCVFPGDCYTKRKCRGCEYRNLFIEEQAFCLSMLSQNGKLDPPYYTTHAEAETALQGEQEEKR